MRLTVIVNPRSQNGALGKRWPDLAKVLGRELGGFDTRMTSAPGDATRLAREAIEAGAEVVVAVGGDGTIHEVAGGFVDDAGKPRRGAALAVLPFGTGGDFRRSIGVPSDLEQAARIIAAGQRQTIDLGWLEYRGHDGSTQRRAFINIASFGLGGLVDQIVNDSSKALGGKLSFFLGTARATFRYKNQPVRMVFDDDEDDFVETVITTVAVANGQFFGGGMQIAPGASLSDGQFDVITLGDLSKLELLANTPRVYKGTHLSLDKVQHRRARVVQARAVRPDAQVLLDVDGEQPGILPARFSILPRAIELVVP